MRWFTRILKSHLAGGGPRHVWLICWGMVLAPMVCTAAQPLEIRPDANAPWGGPVENVGKVLRAAAEPLWQNFPDRVLKPILVAPHGGPITLFRRGPHGEYLVRLNTGNRLWAQHAYQFAHEFAHILANYDEHERSNKWFEESLCETASLFALRRMAETWKTRPPYANWKDYGPALKDYSRQRIDSGKLPPGKTLALWYRENEPLLRQDPCMREKNTIVAVALLPIFEKQPEGWRSIAWLNDGRPHGSRSLTQYFGDWWLRVPEKYRPTVRQITQQFAIDLESVSATRSQHWQSRIAPWNPMFAPP
jgi:hypothetical protein